MKIWIIFKKELKDILRDRRTIMMMIIFPLLIAPAIITGVSKVQMMQMKKAQEKKLKLHFIGKEYAPNLFQEDQFLFLLLSTRSYVLEVSCPVLDFPN